MGLLMFAASGWLRVLYGMTPVLYFSVATANVLYGSYSLSLAIRRHRPLPQLMLLSWANGAWGVVCVAIVMLYHRQLAMYALVHLLVEAAVVFYLACREWIDRVALTGHQSANRT